MRFSKAMGFRLQRMMSARLLTGSPSSLFLRPRTCLRNARSYIQNQREALSFRDSYTFMHRGTASLESAVLRISGCPTGYSLGSTTGGVHLSTDQKIARSEAYPLHQRIHMGMCRIRLNEMESPALATTQRSESRSHALPIGSWISFFV